MVLCIASVCVCGGGDKLQWCKHPGEIVAVIAPQDCTDLGGYMGI